jgi:glycosyltransferase involved in cell wall biosynthesis
MEVSVVIPSYNTIDTITATLDALEHQKTALEYEVIVVDCSEDDAVEQAVAARAQARCIRHPQRFNPGEGRNIGARDARGELLVFVDADVTLDERAIDAAWQFYRQGNRLFGGALELNENCQPTVASYLEHYFFNHESQRQRPSCERANLSSALMVVERDLFLEAGGFADVPRMQDTELTERLRSTGIRLRFAPSVVGYQVQDSPMKKVLRKIYINGQNLYAIRYQSSMNLGKKVVFLLLLPAFAVYKVLRIIGRHLRYQTLRQRGITLLLTPLLFLSGIYWMLGFYKGILLEPGISQQR